MHDALAFSALMRNHHPMTGKTSGFASPTRHPSGRDYRMPLRVRAVLGPTNTGKTHYALERMLAHESGVIAFPLRLLARENYERMVALKGARFVGLITGEEKIVPPEMRWIACTTEAMPLDRKAEFVAIDEIQLCADPDRGHIFTDRLLNARGTVETLFLGAETIRPVLQRLVPEIEIDTRPRLSQLIGTSHTKLSRLPARSAIVAFSAAEVYAIAEAIRQRRGGCAIVMGRMSPRTRNAQVQLYQNKEVDYLVATDAIGMGLNMDVNHVALASLTKFDGSIIRPLATQEIAQIAGRAGRGTREGTFGTTAEARAMSEATVEAIEAHRFDPLSRLFWRNSDLDFTAPADLLASLNRSPGRPDLVPGRPATDLLTLDALAQEKDVLQAARGTKRTRLLWDICQIPDFRKLGDDSHTRLCARLFFHLLNDGSIPASWLESHIAAFSRTDGDIDTLMHRLAGVRTAAYVAARNDWLRDAPSWQERARSVEDTLSDALHERLTARFVDRRATSILRRLDSADDGNLLSAVTKEGAVIVEGHEVGRIEGFTLRPDIETSGPEQKLMLRAGRRALLQEIPRRVQALAEAPDEAFHLDLQSGRILWEDVPIADLTVGPALTAPTVRMMHGEFPDSRQRELVRERLQVFCRSEIGRTLHVLFAARDAAHGDPMLRGVVHRLLEHGGVTPLERSDRDPLRAVQTSLGRLGIRLGLRFIYMPAMLKPRAMTMRALLMAIRDGRSVPMLPRAECASVALSVHGPAARVEQAWLETLGWVSAHQRLIRLDVAERLCADMRKATRRGDIIAPPGIGSALGVAQAQLAETVRALGQRCHAAQPLTTLHYGPASPFILLRSVAETRRENVGSRHRSQKPRKEPTRKETPFAALESLKRKMLAS